MRTDPYLGMRFRVEVEGILNGGCAEVSGLDFSTQVEDFREGGVNDYVHKLPKETTFPNILLKRGLTDSDKLWKWYQDVVYGKVIRKEVHILMLKERSEDVAWVWGFKDAFPIKWTGPELKSEGSTVAFETIEMAHHGFM